MGAQIKHKLLQIIGEATDMKAIFQTQRQVKISIININIREIINKTKVEIRDIDKTSLSATLPSPTEKRIEGSLTKIDIQLHVIETQRIEGKMKERS